MIFLSDNPHVPCTGESDAPVGTDVTIDLEAEDTIVIFALALNLGLDHGTFPFLLLISWHRGVTRCNLRGPYLIVQIYHLS